MYPRAGNLNTARGKPRVRRYRAAADSPGSRREVFCTPPFEDVGREQIERTTRASDRARKLRALRPQLNRFAIPLT